MINAVKAAALVLALAFGSARGEGLDLSTIPPYKKEYDVAGGLRIAGSELKGNVDLLVEGFKKFQPNAVITTNFMTSSEGALGMMFAGTSDVAPMGDDAKITDQMPFYNTYRYVPMEISIATGGFDQRGSEPLVAVGGAERGNQDRQRDQRGAEMAHGSTRGRCGHSLRSGNFRD